MQTLWHDLRFTLRQLRRAPGFTLTAVLTLALGIGANTAIFSLLDQALLRGLPVADPASLVILQTSDAMWSGSTSSHGGPEAGYFSYPMYKDLRDRSRTPDGRPIFAGLLATNSINTGFAASGQQAAVVDTELVSGNYFDVLGVVPALGRTLHQADDVVQNGAPVAVASYDFWRTRLGANPGAVGETVTLNGHPFQLVGVAPRGFQSAIWGQTPGLFVPMTTVAELQQDSDTVLTEHPNRWLNILGRLAPGVSPQAAAVAMQPLWHSLREAEFAALRNRSPRFRKGFLDNNHLVLQPGKTGLSYNRDTLRTPFLVVMAMAVLGLLIAAVNVASLLLVRSAGRVREFALRAALGARRSRVLGQLVLEGLVLGVAGGLCGLLLAPLALHGLTGFFASDDGRNAFSASLDARVLGFNFAVAVGVSLLFSLAPALELRRLNLVGTLRENSSTGPARALSLRHAIVAAQVGLGVVLLLAAGLFVRTLERLQAVDPGFNTSHLVAFAVDPTLSGYTAPAALATVDQKLLDALSAVPGVERVTATNDAELENNNSYNNMTVSGYRPPPDTSFSVETPTVAAGYFETLQQPLLMGRSLALSDTATGAKVAVVNMAFAKHFCGNEPATCLGRLTAMGEGDKIVPDRQIVGIVGDLHHSALSDPARATLYRPLAQTPGQGYLTFYLRTRAEPGTMLEAARRAVRTVDPGLALTNLRTMDTVISNSLQNQRIVELLAVAFGALAAVLAGVGLYGVLAYTTAQRTREIGIRMALGSTRAAVARLVLADLARVAAVGVVLAVPAAWALSRLVEAQLFQASVADPMLLAAVLGLMAVVALLAALVPVRRAASVAPSVALRTE